MKNERIQILKEILLKLHLGASPESVQEDFNNHLPMEITFVNKDNLFQYYNDFAPTEEMIFKRTPSQVGRQVELCHLLRF